MRWWWAIVVYVIAIVVTSALSYGGLLIGWEWISSQGQMVGYALALPIVLLVFGRKLSRPLGWIGFVLAAFFTLAYLTTSSLTGAVAAHAVNNIISLYGALAVMGNLQWWVWVVPAAGGIIAIAVSVALGGVFDKADNDASIAATHGTSS